MKVLLATDGFAPAQKALTLIARLADPCAVEVTVLSVASSGYLASEPYSYLPDLSVELKKNAEETTEEAAEFLKNFGISATTKILEGGPGTQILEEAEKGYDLIALGAGSSSWLGNLLLGSTSTHVLHSARVSVLVVHDAIDEMRTGRILLGVDGSIQSMEAARVLVSFANPEQAEVKVMSTIPVQPSLAYGWGGDGIDAGTEAQFRKAQSETAEKAVSETASLLRSSGFKVEMTVVLGHPATMLLEEAASGGFDLVAVGSRGLGPVGRALMGSVSDHVARLSRAALVAR